MYLQKRSVAFTIKSMIYMHIDSTFSSFGESGKPIRYIWQRGWIAWEKNKFTVSFYTNKNFRVLWCLEKRGATFNYKVKNVSTAYCDKSNFFANLFHCSSSLCNVSKEFIKKWCFVQFCFFHSLSTVLLTVNSREASW